jgi:hypothetical protein
MKSIGNASPQLTSQRYKIRCLLAGSVILLFAALPASAQASSKPSVAEVMRTMKVGSTTGRAAIEALRKKGFVVFDYRVCSNSIRGIGVLRQVRDRKSQRILFDKAGLTKHAIKYRVGTVLDVLVTSGKKC